MPVFSFPNGQQESAAIPNETVIRIITQQLPGWKAASDNPDAETVILDQRAFGNSHEELFLLSLAIRYAGIAKKNVTIAA
jgi:hypothetical protein